MYAEYNRYHLEILITHDMLQIISETARRYLIALTSVAGVFGLTVLLSRFVQADVSALYLVAVMFAAWRGGLGAGLLATVLSVAIATYFFLAPIYSFSLKAEGVVELVVFTLAAILTSSLSASREKAIGQERAARLEAESAGRVKDEFIAAVSHELRTPLTTIKTLTRLLLRKDPSEEQRKEYLEDIALECERQIDFVHNLLDLSRIHAGGVNITLGRVNAETVLRDCENIVRVSAASRDHTLTLNIDEDLPPIRGEHNALRRALCALVENSIKYTPIGGNIGLAARGDGDSDHAVIEVSDNGRGIRGEDLPHIFDRFYRGSVDGADPKNGNKSVPGIGLGLYLARELIDGMGGTISVESNVGEGSTFRVRIPVWTDATDQ